MLQHRGDALQAHTGIHAWRRQWQQSAIGLTVELHEHVVPYLDKTVAVFIRRTRRTSGNMRTMVEEDFGTRTTGAGISHLPEVVRSVRRAFIVANTYDSIGRQTNFVMPDIVGLVIGVINGNQQLFFRQCPYPG